MAVKTKSKAKTKTGLKAKPMTGKKKVAAPSKRQPVAVKAQESKTVRAKPKSIVLSNTRTSTPGKPRPQSTTKVRMVNKLAPTRSMSAEERRYAKSFRAPQYNYMNPPGMMHDFQVGDTVEVYCDHEKNRERIRGWIRGIVVQVDNKLVAVQFRSNVFLTDGWMVPDRILWYPLNSEHMRPVPGKKSSKRELAIPDY
jgi:hypothetical protein